jgi:hypothetical protein
VIHIQEGTWLELDNGLRCLVQKSYDSQYTYDLNYMGFILNSVHDYYLDDCVRYGQPICIGRYDNGELKYAKIIAVDGQLIETEDDMDY